jgi:hypothetical protein
MTLRTLVLLTAVGTVALGPAARAADEALKKEHLSKEQHATAPFPYFCDVEHKDAIRVLYLMADTVKTLPTAPDRKLQASENIRKAADTLDQSHPTALHTPQTKQALVEVVSVLDAIPNKSPALTQKTNEAHAQLDLVDIQVPYLKQRPTVDLAFREVSDALKLASSEAQLAASTTPPAPPAPTPPPVAVQHKIYLDRWAFDQAGPQPNVQQICQGGTVSRVETHRGGGDIFMSILTIGMYTPSSVRVTCMVPQMRM